MMLKEAIEEASVERDEFSFVLVSNIGRLEYTGNLESGLRFIKLMNYKEDPIIENPKTKIVKDLQVAKKEDITVLEMNFKADVESGASIKQLAYKYHKSEQTIKIWLHKFNLNQKKTPKMN